MEHRRRRPDQAQPGRRTDPQAARRASRRAACCITGRAKWYPGESLPRWAFGLYWRKDGVPIWSNPDLIASDRACPRNASDRGRQATSPAGIAERLGLAAELRRAGLRRSGALAAEGGRLPANVDPIDSKLADAEERARIARVFDRGLGDPDRLRAAGPALERRRPALEQRALEAAARQAVPDAGRFPGRLPAADGVAAVGGADRLSPCHAAPTRSSRTAASCPIPRRWRQRVVQSRRRCPPGRPASQQDATRIAAARPARTMRCAPRSRSRCATASCASSCRRSRSSRTISN